MKKRFLIKVRHPLSQRRGPDQHVVGRVRRRGRADPCDPQRLALPAGRQRRLILIPYKNKTIFAARIVPGFIL